MKLRLPPIASVALARLPNASCDDCAAHLEILDQNGNALTNGYVPGPNMNLRLVANKANVLNITAAAFAAMGNMSFEGAAPSTNTPLIVNIVDAGDVTLTTYPGQGGIGDWVRSTLWDFPNAHTVRLQSGNDGVWGTVFAPAAHVISSVKIEGGVVAAR